MIIHLAEACWPFEKEKNKSGIKSSGSFTLRKVRAVIKKEKLDFRNPHVLNGFHIECMYHGARRALTNAVKFGKAIKKQDGHGHGWGISTCSLQEAKELALVTAAEYEKQEKEEMKQQEQKNNKTIARLDELSVSQLQKTVYFYFKQDYSYRGLEDTYKGKIKVSDLVEYEKLQLNNGDTDIVTDRIAKALKFNSNFEHSFLDFEFPIVKKFLKKGSISAMDEIGYAAFSLKSAADAREMVKEMVVDNEMDD